MLCCILKPKVLNCCVVGGGVSAFGQCYGSVVGVDVWVLIVMLVSVLFRRVQFKSLAVLPEVNNHLCVGLLIDFNFDHLGIDLVRNQVELCFVLFRHVVD